MVIIDYVECKRKTMALVKLVEVEEGYLTGDFHSLTFMSNLMCFI